MHLMVIDPFTLLLAVAAAGIAVWYVRNRRRPTPPEDEWVLPPEEGQPSILSQRSSAPFQVLDRDSLLNRDRTLDTSKWDDTPDDLIGIDPDPEDGQDPEGGPAPAVVDSSFIDSLRREAEKAETADEEDDPS